MLQRAGLRIRFVAADDFGDNRPSVFFQRQWLKTRQQIRPTPIRKLRVGLGDGSTQLSFATAPDEEQPNTDRPDDQPQYTRGNAAHPDPASPGLSRLAFSSAIRSGTQMAVASGANHVADQGSARRLRRNGIIATSNRGRWHRACAGPITAGFDRVACRYVNNANVADVRRRVRDGNRRTCVLANPCDVGTGRCRLVCAFGAGISALLSSPSDFVLGNWSEMVGGIGPAHCLTPGRLALA
ncbi:hypothetical protein HRbin36_01295 [bacterium HR36]|nr:hypothetical protein HRbin36_01295 [bacterium HR36]